MAIDPKGYVGEVVYEIGAMLRNPIDFQNISTSPQIIKQRITTVCNKLGYDEQRVIGWAFAQAVLAGVWSVESGNSPAWAVNVAMQYEKLLS